MIKQIIVVRKDLHMGAGKMGAQIGHASTGVFFKNMTDIDAFDGGELKKVCILHETYVMREWRLRKVTNGTNGKKVVVECYSEEHLLRLQREAEEAGIANYLVQDSGTTFFKQECPVCNGTGALYRGFRTIDCNECHGSGKIPKPTYTVLAIGPDFSEKIDLITKNLRLMR